MESLQVIESSFVAPKEATPTKGLWLSPVDLAATRGHTTIVFFYPSGAAFFDAARLKEAMAKALVAFYPLAGRLGFDNDGRLEISCNGEGVLFVVARSSLVAEDFDFSKPSLELRTVFVPRIEPPSLIMAIQVTFFKCGGVALGVASHHAAVDGISTFHFIKTWSALSRDGDGAAIELPCHLRARSPPVVHPDAVSVLYPQGHLVPVVVETKRHRGVSHLQGPAGHPEAPLRRGKHLLLRQRPKFVHIMNGAPENHCGDRAVRVVVCMEATNLKEFQRLLYANIAKQASKL